MSTHEDEKDLIKALQETSKKRHEQAALLLRSIKAHLPALEPLLKTSQTHWVGEDGFYRFYHQSFKVYNLQNITEKIIEGLKTVGAEAGLKTLNPYFTDIINEGTKKVFNFSHNQHWTKQTRPILEAFFHAREMLHLTTLYGKALQEAPTTLPSGWAAILYLYNIR